MNGLALASVLIPEAAYPLLLVLAGFLMIIGQGRLALSMNVFVFQSKLVPPLLAPLLAQPTAFGGKLSYRTLPSHRRVRLEPASGGTINHL